MALGPTREPVARAAVGQSLLTTLRNQYGQHRQAIESALTAPARDSFASLNALRWIPMAHHMELSDLIRERVGEGAANERFWEAAFEELLRRPLLRNFVQMILRVPDNPHVAMFRYGPRIFDHIFRDCGTSTTKVFTRPDAPTFIGTWTYEDFPAAEFTFECFVEGFQGAIRGSNGVFPGSERITASLTSASPAGMFELAVGLER
ncbi:MAG: hypothetical protein AAF645_08225 [Myxococcota bacterium]